MVRALLSRCMAALANQSLRGFEVILVDDGSMDDTPRTVMGLRRELPLDLKSIRLPVARGPAHARNQGWRATRADFIAFTDDDCEPEPEWLARLVEALSHAAADIAGVGGRVMAAGDGLVSRYMSYHRVLEPPPSRAYLVTANCIYRRGALDEVGGFNPQVRSAGGEDPGLSFALRDRGYRFGFTERAVVRHHFREGLLGFVRTFYRYGKGYRLVMDRGFPLERAASLAALAAAPARLERLADGGDDLVPIRGFPGVAPRATCLFLGGLHRGGQAPVQRLGSRAMSVGRGVRAL